MIEGIFANNTPYIRIELINKDQSQKEWFVLDTGFSGDLHISRRIAKELSLNQSSITSFIMANGKFVKFPSATLTASLGDDSHELDVLVSEGSALAGIGFLYKFGYRAILDGKYKTVQLEKA